MVYWKGVVYAADISTDDEPDNDLPEGRLLAYDARTGRLLRQFSPLNPPEDFAHNFHPRGLVIGPNGLLYVTSLPNVPAPPTPRLGGQIFVFDPETFDFLGVLVDDPGGFNALNRPDAIVFGPDGNLYVTSFRADATDADAIRIYDGHTGVFIKEIEFSTPPEPRALRKACSSVRAASSSFPSQATTPPGQIRTYNVETEDISTCSNRPTPPGVPAGAPAALVPHLRQNQSRHARLRRRQSRRRPQARLASLKVGPLGKTRFWGVHHGESRV